MTKNGRVEISVGMKRFMKRGKLNKSFIPEYPPVIRPGLSFTKLFGSRSMCLLGFRACNP
jgi:hypothetical protein